jgi:hypothetical protein
MKQWLVSCRLLRRLGGNFSVHAGRGPVCFGYRSLVPGPEDYSYGAFGSLTSGGAKISRAGGEDLSALPGVGP